MEDQDNYTVRKINEALVNEGLSDPPAKKTRKISPCALCGEWETATLRGVGYSISLCFKHGLQLNRFIRQKLRKGEDPLEALFRAIGEEP